MFCKIIITYMCRCNPSQAHHDTDQQVADKMGMLEVQSILNCSGPIATTECVRMNSFRLANSLSGFLCNVVYLSKTVPRKMINTYTTPLMNCGGDGEYIYAFQMRAFSMLPHSKSASTMPPLLTSIPVSSRIRTLCVINIKTRPGSVAR